ncbi:MAG: DUF1573 domain-containing protein [Bacteroidales bacterium]|jgi:hypothetical protein|nr:DUF1573 domain-containing protein [Bacteroidales bacterium]
MKKLLVSVITLVAVTTFINAQAPTAAELRSVVESSLVNGASIQFENVVHDYGTIARGANGDCEFIFTNVGTEPLKLTSVTASCGCTIPSWTKDEVAPGASSVIKVHYDTNRIGGINKTITVISNDAAGHDRTVLRIAGTVQAQ